MGGFGIELKGLWFCLCMGLQGHNMHSCECDTQNSMAMLVHTILLDLGDGYKLPATQARLHDEDGHVTCHVEEGTSI